MPRRPRQGSEALGRQPTQFHTRREVPQPTFQLLADRHTLTWTEGATRPVKPKRPLSPPLPIQPPYKPAANPVTFLSRSDNSAAAVDGENGDSYDALLAFFARQAVCSSLPLDFQSSLGESTPVPRWLKRCLWGLVIAAVSLAIAGFLLFRAAQSVPEFYEQAIEFDLPPREQAFASEQVEHEVLELHNEVRTEESWDATFSDQQVNAWLALDLPEKFPGALPPEISQPRVRFEKDHFHAGATYQIDDMKLVVSVSGDLYMTDQPNEVALRLRSVRAGMIPLPLKRVLGMVTQAANQAGLVLRWTKQDGDPVALLQLPPDQQQIDGRRVQLDTLELRENSLFIAGRTVAEEAAKSNE